MLISSLHKRTLKIVLTVYFQIVLTDYEMSCTKVTRQQPYFYVTLYIFVYTAWTILHCYHKITFYNRGLKLWRELRKAGLFE